MDGTTQEEKTMAEIELPEQAIELSFHPERDVVATALVTGKVCLHTYSEEGHTLELELSHHQESCRSVLFSEDGKFLRTASKDRSIAEVAETGQVTWRQQGAHDWSVNVLYGISRDTLASGDDQGAIKIWDTRQRREVTKFHVNEDFISDMIANEAGDKLLATSGDASLAVVDLRQRKVEGRVTNKEDELLSVQIIKDGSRVVCGTQSGVIVSWPWGTWGSRSNRFRGHPNSVDTLLKLDEDTLLTGSSDGIIRVITVQPDQFLGLLGDHEDFPVESIKVSRDRKWIGSVSHDNLVRFWHAGYLFEDDGDDEEQEKGQGQGARGGDEEEKGEPPGTMEMDSDDMEDDGDDDGDSDEGSGSDEDEDMTGSRSKRRKEKKGKRRKNDGMRPPKKSENFFDDL